jgi:hypothetical protein
VTGTWAPLPKRAPGALDLFRQILIASMSIPGAVSPVMIGVEVNGQQFRNAWTAASSRRYFYPQAVWR